MQGELDWAGKVDGLKRTTAEVYMSNDWFLSR